ncbi:hypothetical protein evm_002426 [Chilo suppressalis]|nr:hypothetical protein evm_002426 [Chilo suppressalis]
MPATDAFVTERVFEWVTADSAGGSAAAASSVLRAGLVLGGADSARSHRLAAALRSLDRPRVLALAPARPIFHNFFNRIGILHIHLRVDTEETNGETNTQDESIFGRERGASAGVGCSTGAAGRHAEDGEERDLRVQPAALPTTAPAPLPGPRRPALQLLL